MTALRHYAFRFSATCAAALFLSPTTAADTQLITSCPQMTETGGVIMAQTETECPTGGSYQYSASASPAETDFPYPWDDPFYGSALLIGGFGPRPVPAPAPAPAPGR